MPIEKTIAITNTKTETIDDGEKITTTITKEFDCSNFGGQDLSLFHKACENGLFEIIQYLKEKFSATADDARSDDNFHVSVETQTEPITDFGKMKVSKLREMCAEHNLPTNGLKRDLIERIQNYQKPQI